MFRISFLSFLVVVFACKCGIAQADLPFAIGEKLEYNVKWTGVPAGTSVFKVLPGHKENELRIELRNSSNRVISWMYKVNDHIESTILKSSMSSVRFYKDLQQGRRHIREITDIDYDKKSIHYSKQSLHANEKANHQDVAFDAERLFDPLSMIYFLRSVDFSDSAERDKEYKVFTDGKIYNISFSYKGEKEIITPSFGSRKVYHIMPNAQYEGTFITKGKLDVYIDIETGVPLRFNFHIPVGWAGADLNYTNIPALEDSKSPRSSRRRSRR